MHPFYQRQKQLQPGMIALTSVPFDEYSSFRRGPAQAPQRIRAAFHSDSANTFAEDGTDIKGHPQLLDLGPVPFEDYLDISRHYEALLQHDVQVLSFGGDHSVTYPIVKAFAKKHPDLTILQVDAHSDLYDEFEGNRYSHACPFARIMEEGLAKRLVQVGVRTLTTHQREQAARFGVEIHEMKDGIPEQLELTRPLYLSIDMDALDPAFAPGISHYEPGGLSVREVLRLIRAVDVPIAGADIVEYNPLRDRDDQTAMVAAKFFREVAAKMLAKRT